MSRVDLVKQDLMQRRVVMEALRRFVEGLAHTEETADTIMAIFAQAGEAGTAETPKSDSVHEHAVAQPCAHICSFCGHTDNGSRLSCGVGGCPLGADI